MIIDIFNHFMPRPYFDRLALVKPDLPILELFPRLPSLVNLDDRLRILDEFGDLQQVLSLANPPPEVAGPPEVAIELARIANDALAEICSKYRDRFPTFIASVPMNDVEGAVAEIDRAVNHLNARGIQLFTNVLGKPLSAPEFRPVFQRMAEHDLPILVHPIRGPHFPDYQTEHLSENEIWFCFGWPYETTACMTRLIYSRIFDELPNLKIVSHHMGGMIPYFESKVKLGFRQVFFGTKDKNPTAVEAGLKRPLINYYKMLYGDTALGGELEPTRCGYSFFGPRNTLFATDAPFDPEQGRGLIGGTISGVRALDLPESDLALVCSGNARRLLKL